MNVIFDQANHQFLITHLGETLSVPSTLTTYDALRLIAAQWPDAPAKPEMPPPPPAPPAPDGDAPPPTQRKSVLPSPK